MQWSIVLSYLCAGAFTIFVLWLLTSRTSVPTARTVTGWQTAFIAVLAAMLFATLFKRFRSRVIWEAMFTLTIFFGIWYVLLLILPFGWAIAIASALTLLQVFFPYVFLHNAFYLLGASGVAINFAGWLSPDVLLVGLVVFTVYDMVAAAPGGPVHALAQKLLSFGIVPGLVVVGRARDMAMPLDDAIRENNAFLGAGDVILPMTLVARAAIGGAGFGAFVLLGLVVSAFVLGSRADLHPRAALPVLAMGVAVPFLLLRILSYV